MCGIRAETMPGPLLSCRKTQAWACPCYVRAEIPYRAMVRQDASGVERVDGIYGCERPVVPLSALSIFSICPKASSRRSRMLQVITPTQNTTYCADGDDRTQFAERIDFANAARTALADAESINWHFDYARTPDPKNHSLPLFFANTTRASKIISHPSSAV